MAEHVWRKIATLNNAIIWGPIVPRPRALRGLWGQ